MFKWLGTSGLFYITAGYHYGIWGALFLGFIVYLIFELQDEDAFPRSWSRF